MVVLLKGSFDGRKELRFVEWLQEHRIRPESTGECDACGGVHVSASAGDRENGRRAHFPFEFSDDVEPIAIGHEHVSDHQIKVLVTCELERFVTS